MIDANGIDVPGFWMYETSGILRPVVEKYLRGDALSPEECSVMRAYLRQWINAPGFRGEEIDRLRAEIDGLLTTGAIREWTRRAVSAGVDPF